MSNEKLESTIVYGLLEDIKKEVKANKSTQLNISAIDNLTLRLEQTISATQSCSNVLSATIEQARKPIVSERRTIIEIASKGVIFTFIGVIIIIAALSSRLYFVSQPNYDHIDNDLKYRYIKMKGEASPKRISELENLFEINRDNVKIRQMLKDVADYEQAVKEKATLEEQARLRQLEAERLTYEAEKLKQGK